MTPSDPNQQQLRQIARHTRFLAYRAGAPNPITKSIFVALLVPFALIVILGFCFEVAVQFGFIKPAHKSDPPSEEIRKQGLHRNSREASHETVPNA